MKNKKGFTLAELLVVVAIIAVLVAISIPLFSSQIEKAREATDLANIRSAYAELMTAVITGDTEVDNNGNSDNDSGPLKSNPNIYYFEYDNNPGQDGNVKSQNYFIMVDMCQKQDGWQTPNALDSLKELFTEYNDGNPSSNAEDYSFDKVGKDSVASIIYTIKNNKASCSIVFNENTSEGD